MAYAVLALSVHPIIKEHEVDDHKFVPAKIDLPGLCQTIAETCCHGNRNAVMRIANSYVDLDGANYLQSKYDKLTALKLLGEPLMERAGVRGASRNGVISIADQWQATMEKDMAGELLAPSLIFLVVRASTSLTVGDWLQYGLDQFDSLHFPAGLLSAFGATPQAPSKGRLPQAIREKLTEVFGIEFADHAKLTLVCRKG